MSIGGAAIGRLALGQVDTNVVGLAGYTLGAGRGRGTSFVSGKLFAREYGSIFYRVTPGGLFRGSVSGKFALTGRGTPRGTIIVQATGASVLFFRVSSSTFARLSSTARTRVTESGVFTSLILMKAQIIKSASGSGSRIGRTGLFSIAAPRILVTARPALFAQLRARMIGSTFGLGFCFGKIGLSLTAALRATPGARTTLSSVLSLVGAAFSGLKVLGRVLGVNLFSSSAIMVTISFSRSIPSAPVGTRALIAGTGRITISKTVSISARGLIVGTGRSVVGKTVALLAGLRVVLSSNTVPSVIVSILAQVLTATRPVLVLFVDFSRHIIARVAGTGRGSAGSLLTTIIRARSASGLVGKIVRFFLPTLIPDPWFVSTPSRPPVPGPLVPSRTLTITAVPQLGPSPRGLTCAPPPIGANSQRKFVTIPQVIP
jgi:hypothetical protein